MKKMKNHRFKSLQFLVHQTKVGNTTFSKILQVKSLAVPLAKEISLSILFIFALFISQGLYSQNIYTVAGNFSNAAGYSGDGGAATSAQINGPYDATPDFSGNLFVVDYGNNVIRKIEAATGIISTVAGTGTAGYSGDGGVATLAKLSSPESVSVDASGNLYIADVGNNVIRKVAATTGIISTIAGTGTAGYSGNGGAATLAKLNSPANVAVDASGNLYITDYGNNVIRKVTTSTGIITTVAGTGTPGYSGNGGAATSAKLKNPYWVAVDASGNLYIDDFGNKRIRKVTASTGIISNVAGNGTGGYSGDGGLATSAKIYPYSVAVDASGNLYISGGINNRVRKVSASTGIISTVVGTGTAGFSGDGAAATSAKINTPYSVEVLSSSGDLFISDYGNNVVRQVTTMSPLPVTFISFTAALQSSEVKLGWLTSNEVNNSRFEVERSIDGKNYITIGTVMADLIQATTHSYSFTDGNPSLGFDYYRLKQIDIDGNYLYSSVQSVQFGQVNLPSVKLYPNPTNSSQDATLTLGSSFQHLSVCIVNMAGQTLSRQNFSFVTTSVTISTASLPKGIYYVLAIVDGKSLLPEKLVIE